MPRMLDLALKWRKGKESWLNHVYNNHIKVLSKEQRNARVKQCLGLRKRYDTNDMYAYLPCYGISRRKITNFIQEVKPEDLKKLLTMDFHDTIKWELLSDEETNYWKTTESWVRWFSSEYQFLENSYKISRQCGKNEFDIRVELINHYLSALLPKQTDDENTKQAKYNYLDKFVDFLIDSFEGRI